LSKNKNFVKLYEEYKNIYKEDSSRAKELNSTFDMPIPEVWDKESVRLRAFLDRDSDFYEKSLAPFEFSLKKHFTNDDQTKYEELITVYRDEFFSYSERSASYGFLLGSENDMDSLAQEIALEQESEPIKHFVFSWQKRIEELKSKNIDTVDVTNLRMQEKEILQEFSDALSMLIYTINNYSKSLEILLSDYTAITLQTASYALQTYFENMYDLSDEIDLVEYLKTQEKPNIENDIAHIRAIIQSKISNNNKEAELAQKNATQTTMGEILLEFASYEQDIVSHYRSLVAKYFSYIGVKGDFLLINEPFELYFDNYFADFENTLSYYKLFYKEIEKPLTQTPYYLKMFNATQAKISMLNLNIEEVMHETKKAYISKRTNLIELKLVKREYSQEFDILLSEFKRYGELYIKEIKSNQADLEEHSANIAEIQERFDLREEYGFF